MTAPTSPLALRARSLLERGDYGDAFTAARAALAADPRDLEALLTVAELALETGNRDLFRKMVVCAHQQAPEDGRSSALLAEDVAGRVPKLRMRAVNYAKAILAEGRAGDALARAQMLLQCDAHNAAAHGVAGHAQLALGKATEGLESLRAATRFDPASAECWCELGSALRIQGDWTGAAGAWERAQDREPGNEGIAALLAEARSALPPGTSVKPRPAGPRDLLVCGPEMNRRHGTGILLRRLFPDSSPFVTLRSQNVYDGVEEFGGANLLLAASDLPLAERETQMRGLLAPYEIRRILCVPYHTCDFQHGYLARKISGAPLCTYVMDDQNVYADKVPDEAARTLFEASDLRLAISPEMSEAYGKKYAMVFDPMPPVLDSAAGRVANAWNPREVAANRCALIGTMWSGVQWKQLRAGVREAGLKIDWFGYDSSIQTKSTRKVLERDGIFCQGMLPEEDLVRRLATYPFVVVPSGLLDGTEDNEWLTRLSLPSRMIYVLVKTLTPMLVLGHPDTAAGRFATRFGLGLCASTGAAETRAKIKLMGDPETRGRFVQRARQIADCFVMADGGEWIWRSLAAGRAQPTPFNELLQASDPVPTGHEVLAEMR